MTLCVLLQLDVLFGNLGEMVEFQVEFLRTLEDGIRLVPDLDRLERVEHFKVGKDFSNVIKKVLLQDLWLTVLLQLSRRVRPSSICSGSAVNITNVTAAGSLKGSNGVETCANLQSYFNFDGTTCWFVFTESALLLGRFLPVLRRSLQDLQRLLCQPHKGPKGAGER